MISEPIVLYWAQVMPNSQNFPLFVGESIFRPALVRFSNTQGVYLVQTVYTNTCTADEVLKNRMIPTVGLPSICMIHT